MFGELPSNIDKNSLPKELHIMGNSGIFTKGNLTIVYYIETNECELELGKRKREEDAEDFTNLENQIKDLKTPCDILITNHWPSNILSNIQYVL